MTSAATGRAELDKPFPCLICGKRLEAAACADEINADLVVTDNYGVHYGIPFMTTGAYGSQILDCDGPIHFVICDVCLLQRRHRILGKPTGIMPIKQTDNEETYINGIELFEEWLQYIKNKESSDYWDNIKDGYDLVE